MKILYITSDAKKNPISNKFLNYTLLVNKFNSLTLMITKEHKLEIDKEKNIIYLPKKIAIKKIPLLTINYSFKQIREEIEKHKLDAIHVVNDNSLIKLGEYFKKTLGIPLLVSLDQINLKKSDYASIDELIVNDKKCGALLSRHLLNRYINTIEFGFDIKKFNATTSDVILRDNKKTQLKINATSKIFLANDDKNLEIVVRGYKNFCLSHPECDSVLIIMCGGKPSPNIKELVKEFQLETKVRFVKNVTYDEMIILYKMSDVYLGVNQSNNIHYLYAMISNTISLASYDTSLSNLIKDGISGFYFRDVDSFSKTLYQIINLDDENKSKLNEAAKEIASRYDKEEYLNKMKKTYEKAIRNNW